MREFNLFEGYPKPSKPRQVGKNIRTIKDRIISSYRDKNHFDGDRNYGYGGFKYDGRWKMVANKIIEEYKLNNKSSFLQLNCEKGFLIKDIKDKLPNSRLVGLETSDYAISNSITEVKKNITKVENYLHLSYENNSFDFVMGIGAIYTQNLNDAIKSLKEIQRVGKGKSFVNLASYKNNEDYWLFKDWTLIGTIILKKEEWLEVLKHANYTGDYFFTNAETLSLERKK